MGRRNEVTDQQIIVVARRCFLERGTSVSAADIAREVGVSHTTLFNRFGSKEGLLIAALGAPSQIEWVISLEAGPDERPIREQLVAHTKAMTAFFQDLQTGFGILQAAGIDPSKAHRAREGGSAPERAYRSLVSWLTTAQDQGRLAKCDAEALASTILGALQGWVFTTRMCGESAASGSANYVERFIELLWNGIGSGEP